MSRARTPEQDANPIIDAAKVTAMEFPELLAYVEDRLRGRSLNPPLDERSGEEPADFLMKVYEQGAGGAFKKRFGRAIAELLASEMVALSDVDYLSSLLAFCERYTLVEAAGPIGGLVFDERLKGRASTNGDLHRQALLAFARLPQAAKWRDLWACSIQDSRYTAVSFTALRSKGLNVILHYLPELVSQSLQSPGCLNLRIAIGTLYEEFDDLPKAELSRQIMATVEGDENLESTLGEAVRFHDSPTRDCPQNDAERSDAATAAVR